MRGALRCAWIEVYIVGTTTAPVTFQKCVAALQAPFVWSPCLLPLPAAKQAQVLVLKPGCHLQHLERPQKKKKKWKFIHLIEASCSFCSSRTAECLYMPTVSEQIYWCFLKTFTLWTSNFKIEAEDSDSHFVLIALFGDQLTEMVLWPIQHCFSRVTGDYTGFQE